MVFGRFGEDFSPQEASEASPVWLVASSFLWVSLGFPCFSLPGHVIPFFLLLCFPAFPWASFFVWFLSCDVNLPCFPLLSLALTDFSCFTLCQHFLKKIALPVHLLRQVFFWGSLGRIFSFFCSTSFWDGFFIDFGCIFKANIRPKIKILGGFWNLFLATSF